MHYKDGQLAANGDLVVGTSYNRKDVEGKPLVQVGVIFDINPAQTSCNCKVATGFAAVSAPAGNYGTGAVIAAPGAFDYSDCGQSVKLTPERIAEGSASPLILPEGAVTRPEGTVPAGATIAI